MNTETPMATPHLPVGNSGPFFGRGAPGPLPGALRDRFTLIDCTPAVTHWQVGARASRSEVLLFQIVGLCNTFQQGYIVGYH